MFIESQPKSDQIVDLPQSKFLSKAKTQKSLGARLLRVIDRWIDRNHQRRDLASLDDRLLRDIGISRYQAYRECTKPFWR